MKKCLFWATVVGALLTGCVHENDAVLTTEDNPQTITFEVAKYKASSRADDDSQAQSTSGYTAFPQNHIFGTFAYMAGSIAGEHETFMDNEKVGYVSNVWVALGDTYFWPQVGHVDFISYYPHSSYEGGIEPEIGHSTSTGQFNTLSFLNYTVSQVDLMYSDKAHLQTHNYTTYGKSGVPTLFRHALAKLNFKVKTKYLVSTETMANGGGTMKVLWNVLVKSIKLNDLHGTGSVHLETTSPTASTVPQTTTWSIVNSQAGNVKVWTPSGTANVNKEWTVSNGQSLSVEAAVFGNASDYYVLPQNFTNGLQSVTITYSVSNKQEGAESQSESTEFVKTLYFFDYKMGVPAWEMGKNITYTFEIDPKGDVINFDPAVADWEIVSGTLDI